MFAVEVQVSGPSSVRLSGDAPCRDRCGPSGRSPLVTWHTRDLPNLCTFLGTTRRSVDDGHRAHTDGYPVVSGLPGYRLIHTAVDRPWDERARGRYPAAGVVVPAQPRSTAQLRGSRGVTGRPGCNIREVAARPGELRRARGSARQGHGAWWRCGPHGPAQGPAPSLRGVGRVGSFYCLARLLMRAVSSVTWV